MQADFLDAHDRHWTDAELLFTGLRWANADHLYGVAAECGLKRLMLAFGMKFDATKDRPSDRDDRVHADGVWVRFESYRSGHPQGASYTLPSSSPFQDWKVDQRYAPQSNFDQVRAGNHRAAARTVGELISKAKRDGLLI